MGFADFLSLKGTDGKYSFEILADHLNGHGTAHGGILYSLCAEAIAMYLGDIEKRDGVGAEGSIHYYKAAKPGETLTITVTPRKVGKRMGNYLIEIKNENDQLIADSMFTVAFMS